MYQLTLHACERKAFQDVILGDINYNEENCVNRTFYQLQCSMVNYEDWNNDETITFDIKEPRATKILEIAEKNDYSYPFPTSLLRKMRHLLIEILEKKDE